MQVLTYRYRLLPTRAQHRALERILEDQRQLYNAALEERIEFYRKTGRRRTYVEQCRGLTECRMSLPEMAALPAVLQRWTLRRLDEAYVAFFRRLKSKGGKSGYPRFRGVGMWKSFGFREFKGVRFDGKRIRFSGLPGALRVHFHRSLPPGRPISCVFTRDAKGWTVCLYMPIATTELGIVQTRVGIDLGIKVFAYQSDGVAIPNPRIAKRAERKLRIKARALARCKKGSNQYRKVRTEFWRAHAKIKNSRNTWLHQQSARVVNAYDLIAVENLNVRGMVQNHSLAKHINDAAWSRWITMIAYKAEKAGRHFVTVDPRNTSQRCSGCGELVRKSLSVRTHSCASCGLEIDRDWNAARNIIAAVVGGGTANVTHWGERWSRNLNEIASN